MARLSDHIKANYEDETLGHFLRFRAEDGGPQYDYVEAGERPDRRIREAGDPTVIGVEITRIVLPDDAEARSDTYHLGDALVSILEDGAPGGLIEVHAGDFPDVTREGIRDLSAALRGEVEAAGGAPNFVEGLPEGFWDYEPEGGGVTRFYFEVSDEPGWKTRSNAVMPPVRRELSETDLDAALLERVTDKVKKAAKYPWEGPLILLVRNPYQAYTPSDDTVRQVRHAAGDAFAQIWLVNFREGVTDPSPPSPGLVRIV